MSASQSLVANVRSPSYFVARTRGRCRNCGLDTRLLALALPPNHETLDPETQSEASETPSSDAWQQTSVSAFLFYIEYLPVDIQQRLAQLSDCFRLAPLPTTSTSYWVNHCEHCHVLLDDDELHCEPDVAFMPSSAAAAAGIELLHIHEPFEAQVAGYASEPEFFRCMRMS